MERKRRNFHPMPHTQGKINSKWITDLNINSKIFKFLGENLHDYHEICKDFINKMQKTLTSQGNIDNILLLAGKTDLYQFLQPWSTLKTSFCVCLSVILVRSYVT